MISYKSLKSIRGYLCEHIEYLEDVDLDMKNDVAQLTKLIAVVENEMEMQEQLANGDRVGALANPEIHVV